MQLKTEPEASNLYCNYNHRSPTVTRIISFLLGSFTRIIYFFTITPCPSDDINFLHFERLTSFLNDLAVSWQTLAQLRICRGHKVFG